MIGTPACTIGDDVHKLDDSIAGNGGENARNCKTVVLQVTANECPEEETPSTETCLFHHIYRQRSRGLISSVVTSGVCFNICSVPFCDLMTLPSMVTSGSSHLPILRMG